MCCSVLNRLASQVSMQISVGRQCGLARTDWLGYPIVHVIIARIPLYNKVDLRLARNWHTVTGLAAWRYFRPSASGVVVSYGVGMVTACVGTALARVSKALARRSHGVNTR